MRRTDSPRKTDLGWSSSSQAGVDITRRQGLRRLKQRLGNVSGESDVQYEPSAELNGEHVEVSHGEFSR